MVGHSLSTYSIEADSTVDLSLRLLGGAKNLQLIIKPRVQKDKWSLYWKARPAALSHSTSDFPTQNDLDELDMVSVSAEAGDGQAGNEDGRFIGPHGIEH